MPEPTTDAEIDARVAALSGEDLRALAAGPEDLGWRRPLALQKRLAGEVLRLRADLAEARRVVESLAARVAAQAELLARRAEVDRP